MEKEMDECATDFLNHLEKVSIDIFLLLDIIFHKKEKWEKFYMDNIFSPKYRYPWLTGLLMVTGSANMLID